MGDEPEFFMSKIKEINDMFTKDEIRGNKSIFYDSTSVDVFWKCNIIF
jgi:hypothetical protein